MNWYACYLLNSITQNKHCFANFSSITCYYKLYEHECDNWLLKLCSLKCWNRLLVVACYYASTRSLLQMLKLRGGVSCRWCSFHDHSNWKSRLYYIPLFATQVTFIADQYLISKEI